MASLYAKKEEMAAPVPGTAPINTPRMLDLSSTILYFSTSRKRVFSFSTLTAVPVALFMSRALAMISVMANRPMSTGMVSIPPSMRLIPKVKRLTPSMGSMPMQEISSPTKPISRPLIWDFPPTLAIIVSPKRARAKYSAGPNFSAKLAMGGAANSRTAQLNRPPMVEADSASCRALNPCPF